MKLTSHVAGAVQSVSDKHRFVASSEHAIDSYGPFSPVESAAPSAPYPSGPFASTSTSYLSAPKKPWASADFLSPFLRSPASATCPKFLSLWHSPRQRRSVTFVALEATVTFWRVRGTIVMSLSVHVAVIHVNVSGYIAVHSSKYATFV